MATSLASRFDAALVSSAKQAQQVTHKKSSPFWNIYLELGAIGTAEKLILQPKITDGLADLCIAGKLSLSIEATVLEGGFQELFSPQVVEAARRNLQQLEYSFVEVAPQSTD